MRSEEYLKYITNEEMENLSSEELGKKVEKLEEDGVDPVVIEQIVLRSMVISVAKSNPEYKPIIDEMKKRADNNIKRRIKTEERKLRMRQAENK